MIANGPSPAVGLDGPLVTGCGCAVRIVFTPSVARASALPSGFGLAFRCADRGKGLGEVVLNGSLRAGSRLNAIFAFSSLSIKNFNRMSLRFGKHMTAHRGRCCSHALHVTRVGIAPLNVGRRNRRWCVLCWISCVRKTSRPVPILLSI